MVDDSGFIAHQDDRYFTPSGYRAILERALELGYRVVPFREFANAGDKGAGDKGMGGKGVGDQPVMLLRHDLDHSLRPIKRFAEMEAELGVKSTYFVQTQCVFYDVLSDECRALIERLVTLGHEIGLHYESGRYVGADGDRNVTADLGLLEELAGGKIVSAAQHLPSDADPVPLLDYVENEAYEARFTDPPMTYISDSLMTWRQASPHDLLDRGVSFQFLTHPETWAESYAHMGEAIGHMKQGESPQVQRQYDALIDFYGRLLAERVERDAAFRRKRATQNA